MKQALRKGKKSFRRSKTVKISFAVSPLLIRKNFSTD
jgi:hypothetical protein